MNLLKKSQLILLKQQKLLPAIPMPGFYSGQKQEKNAIQRKQSDFIKRLKKTKSIMLAQKNRKQKNILNPSYVQNRKRRANQYQTLKSHSNSAIIPSPKNEKSLNLKYQILQKILFPPVHTAVQNVLSPYKKWKHKQFKRQSLINEPVDIGAYLLEKTKQKRKKSLNSSDENQQQKNKYQVQFRNIQTQREQRESKNLTALTNTQAQNIYKSEKRLSNARSYFQRKINKKLFKYYRHQTEEAKHVNQRQALRGWQIGIMEYEHQMLEKQQQICLAGAQC